MSVVSLADVKTHLNMTGTANDTELQRFIDVAEAAIGNRVGPLSPTSVTEVHNGGSGTIVLRQPVAASVTSITYTDGAAGAGYTLDGSTGIVYYGDNYGAFPGGPRNVTVTYIAGWTTLPADLAHAVKELVRELWETQRGSNQGARPGFTDTEDPDFGTGGLPLFPPRVAQLIAPYIVPRVA